MLTLQLTRYQVLFKLTITSVKLLIFGLSDQLPTSLGPQNPQLVILLKRQPIIVLSTIPLINPFAVVRSRTLTVSFLLTFIQTKTLTHYYQLNRFSVTP